MLQMYIYLSIQKWVRRDANHGTYIYRSLSLTLIYGARGGGWSKQLRTSDGLCYGDH